MAWVASGAGIMLVHYYAIEKSHVDAQRLFDPIGTRRLPHVNWTTRSCFAAGIVATWMVMYRATGAMQGFGCRASAAREPCRRYRHSRSVIGSGDTVGR